MIGVDLLEIERMRRPMASPRFVQRVFTDYEREYLSKKKNLQSAAGLFCAKEAVAKALGIGLFGLNPRDIAITHLPSGQPVADCNGQRFSISISHDKTTAVAVAMAE
ncbi:holo-[acyl-carrier-protein] synthase [Clostridia bacterium]|nr:holo-[acyl-carrier-protein] synthase [Clostridia bacterium]